MVDCFRAVREGEVPAALVPIENTIEGSVNQTLDQLAAGGDVWIRGEVILPVRHHLLAPAVVELSAITRVLSHPHATAQCQEFLRANLPGVEIVATNSTADAGAPGGERRGPGRRGHRHAARGRRSTAARCSRATSRTSRRTTPPASCCSAPSRPWRSGPGASGRRSSATWSTTARARSWRSSRSSRCGRSTSPSSRAGPPRPGSGRYMFFIDIEGSRRARPADLVGDHRPGAAQRRPCHIPRVLSRRWPSRARIPAGSG